MAITIGGIVCEEIVGNFAERFHLIDGPTADKAFLCAWADRYTVARGILGLNTAVHIGTFITIRVPLQYPEIPYMYAYQIAIKGVGPPFQSSPQMAFPYAIIMVNYKCSPWSFQGIDDPGGQNQIDPSHPYIYAEQEISSSAEMLTVPGKYAYFKTAYGSDHHSSLIPYGFRIALVDLVITLHRLPYLPTSQALNYAGMINDAPFLGVDTGKLMFNGMTTHQTHSTDGTVNTDATFKFQARSIRWDYGYDPLAASGNGAFDQVVRGDFTTPFITSTDLSTVIPGAYAY